MLDFKIRRGPSSTLFAEPGIINPRLVIEEGCWYLSTDTAELFLGIKNGNNLELKRINGKDLAEIAPESNSNSVVKAEINAAGELVIYYSSGTSEVLGRVVGKDGEPGKDGDPGKDGEDGVAISIKIGDNVFSQNNGIIELPKFATQNYVNEKFATIEVPEIPTKISELQNDVGYLKSIPDNYITKEYNEAFNQTVRYEVLPHEGMLIDYRDSEIRINTSRVKPTAQQAGPTAAPNQYYVQFKAYAPEGAVAFKEWQGNNKDNTLHTFDESFAGTDKFGRNYSLIWMPIASFDGANWSLYGDKSTVNKYLGFYYTFEWYDKDNELIDSHTVRIILTNDTCHNDLVPDAVARRIDEKIAALEIPEEGTGADGFSPIIETRPTEYGYDLTITTKEGTETIQIRNGQDNAVDEEIVRATVSEVLDDTLDESITEKLPEALKTIILHGGSANARR